MASVRQNKISALLQKELGIIFQREARDICGGAMVSVTTVRVTPDLGYAKVYISVFAAKDPEATLKQIQSSLPNIRRILGNLMKNQMRKLPDMAFFIDDSLDYAANIDRILKDE